MTPPVAPTLLASPSYGFDLVASAMPRARVSGSALSRRALDDPLDGLSVYHEPQLNLVISVLYGFVVVIAAMVVMGFCSTAALMPISAATSTPAGRCHGRNPGLMVPWTQPRLDGAADATLASPTSLLHVRHCELNLSFSLTLWL